MIWKRRFANNKLSLNILQNISCTYCVFFAEAYIEELIAEPGDNKLYFTNGWRVESYELESGVSTTVINTRKAKTRGLAVDRNWR